MPHVASRFDLYLPYAAPSQGSLSHRGRQAHAAGHHYVCNNRARLLRRDPAPRMVSAYGTLETCRRTTRMSVDPGRPGGAGRRPTRLTQSGYWAIKDQLVYISEMSHQTP